MIYDKIKHLDRYSGLFPELIEYLKNNDPDALPSGKTEISHSLFVLVNEYHTSSDDIEILENHIKYIDVHMVLAGEEKVAVAYQFNKKTKEYDSEADYELVRANGQFFHFPEKYFMVFYPGEYHRPGISVNEPVLVKKLVFKLEIK